MKKWNGIVCSLDEGKEKKSLLLRKERNYRENYKELKRTSSLWYRIRWTPFFCDESASPWRWVRRLLPLVAMGVGVGLQPGSLVIFSGAAALDPHSAIIFLGLLSVSAMTVSRWPYLFLIAVPWPWLGSRQPCSLSRGDFVAIHPSLQKVDRSKLFEVFIQAYGVVLYG